MSRPANSKGSGTSSFCPSDRGGQVGQASYQFADLSYHTHRYIQKEMHRLHTETTVRVVSHNLLNKTVLLMYLLRPAAAGVAGYVTTRSRSARRGRLGGRCSHCCNTLPLCSRCRAAQLERVESRNDRGQQGLRYLLKTVLYCHTFKTSISLAHDVALRSSPSHVLPRRHQWLCPTRRRRRSPWRRRRPV